MLKYDQVSQPLQRKIFDSKTVKKKSEKNRKETGDRTSLVACMCDSEKIARFKKLKDFCSVSQTDWFFWGRVGKASLSEFP